MTLPLGQRTLRERSAPRSLVERLAESKGFRHGLGKKPLTLRVRRCSRGVTAVLQRSILVIRTRSRHIRALARYSSEIVTEVIATGLSGRSRLFRGALTIWSTTSMPFVTWPKIV
jgi:hypothetical protein